MYYTTVIWVFIWRWLFLQVALPIPGKAQRYIYEILNQVLLGYLLVNPHNIYQIIVKLAELGYTLSKHMTL
jgi:hypothetical protein